MQFLFYSILFCISRQACFAACILSNIPRVGARQLVGGVPIESNDAMMYPRVWLAASICDSGYRKRPWKIILETMKNKLGAKVHLAFFAEDAWVPQEAIASASSTNFAPFGVDGLPQVEVLSEVSDAFMLSKRGGNQRVSELLGVFLRLKRVRSNGIHEDKIQASDHITDNGQELSQRRNTRIFVPMLECLTYH